MDLLLADNRVLRLDQPRLMGVLNVTPDSFSDGGAFASQMSAIDHAAAMLNQGADIIDVGGESTRPGAARISADEQIRRTRDVIAHLQQIIRERESETLISIDTTRSQVARAALDAGADLINDVSAGRDDPAMFELAASRNVPIVLMHMQGAPADMQNNPAYHDVVAEVEAFLLERIAAATAAGVDRKRLIIDPGVGFGKSTTHNLQLLAQLNRFTLLGAPLLLGASRKRFMREILALDDPKRDHRALETATCAVTAMAVATGVRLLRVHDVAANRRAADLAFAVVRARKTPA